MLIAVVSANTFRLLVCSLRLLNVIVPVVAVAVMAVTLLKVSSSSSTPERSNAIVPSKPVLTFMRLFDVVPDPLRGNRNVNRSSMSSAVVVVGVSAMIAAWVAVNSVCSRPSGESVTPDVSGLFQSAEDMLSWLPEDQTCVAIVEALGSDPTVVLIALTLVSFVSCLASSVESKLLLSMTPFGSSSK